MKLLTLIIAYVLAEMYILLLLLHIGEYAILISQNLFCSFFMFSLLLAY